MRTPNPLTSVDPRQISRYRLIGRLGAGGQGVVYLAEDPAGTAVAIKVLHAIATADPELHARFAAELAAVQRVGPLCAARILDADLDAPRPYIVSEYVDGPSLRAAVAERGPLDADAVHRLATNTATALAAIHGAGIVHRDLKPDNVLLGPDGPRLIDFGVARTVGMTMTGSGQMLGTPMYMAPEIFKGERAGPAADVFAWGAVLVYAATGRAAFEAAEPAAAMHRVLALEPDLSGLPSRLGPLVARALAKDPSHRPAAIELLHSLIGATGPLPAAPLSPGDPSVGPPGPASPLGPSGGPAGASGATVPPSSRGGGARRRRAVSVVAALALAAGGLALGLSRWAGSDPGAGQARPPLSMAVTAVSSASPRQASPEAVSSPPVPKKHRPPAPATEPASRTTGHPPSPTPTVKVSRQARPDRTPTVDPEPEAEPGHDETPEPFPREADVVLSNPLGPDSRCSDPQDGPSGLQFRSCIRVTAGQVLFSVRLTNPAPKPYGAAVRVSWWSDGRTHGCLPDPGPWRVKVPARGVTVTPEGRCAAERTARPLAYQTEVTVGSSGMDDWSQRKLSPVAHVYPDHTKFTCLGKQAC
ncbi:serine/threonine protein kinase [Streptosporangium roseum]|uniref:non-specific serine/threonine protein kinase n=1 Tax=Streptosporangium roseum (strain ATCC 12428 / DSM 43021 / JCM 3005 / KCTC 9067 / NCIMB 10171 / NRRL 2505 / NI 9100) TaxID=479432 RepID=D2AV02_STRRD|nr:protein kinase [Streptosporangium roseum]ACZ86864.1 Serine/threonine protein kinase-like protein [Streptosporangium roseum DSM 43021]